MKNSLSCKQKSLLTRERMQLLRLYDKSYSCKSIYKDAQLFKQRLHPLRENTRISPPKSKFTIKTYTKDSYIVNKEKWCIDKKPKEWTRISNAHITKAVLLSNSTIATGRK